MIDEGTRNKWFKFLLIFLIICSVTVNILQNKTIKHQEMAVEHLFKYKKGYMKLMNVLQVSPEDRDSFLESINQKKD
tara:strand:- start:365 stop:595 length:231 start_codon:yes stop_codon:yes gene_type:complete